MLLPLIQFIISTLFPQSNLTEGQSVPVNQSNAEVYSTVSHFWPFSLCMNEGGVNIIDTKWIWQLKTLPVLLHDYFTYGLSSSKSFTRIIRFCQVL